MPQSLKRAHLLWALSFAVLTCGYLCLRYPTLEIGLGAYSSGSTPLHDFAGFFFPVGTQVRAGETQVQGFMYGPVAAIGFAVLSPLGYSAAAWLWASGIVVCTLAVALSPSVALHNAPRWLQLSAIALGISSYPALHNLRFGQVSALIVLLCIASILCYIGGHRRGAGLLLACATAIKFYPGLLVLGFVARRDRRALLAFVIGLCALFVVLPCIAFEIEGCQIYYESIATELSKRLGEPIADPNSQSLASLLERWGQFHDFGWLLGRGGWIRWPMGIAWLAWSTRLVQREDGNLALLGWTGLLLATPFFVLSSWPHYFIYLPFCCAIVGAASLRLADRGWRASASCLVVAAAVCICGPCFDFVNDRVAYVQTGVPLFANCCLMAAMLVVVHGPRFARRLSSSPKLGSIRHPAVAIAFLLVLVVALVGRAATEPYDDAYFFVRFARNFLSTGVFAWNPGEGPVHGNTAQSFQALTMVVEWFAGAHSIAATRVLTGVVAATTLLLCRARMRSAADPWPMLLLFTSPMVLPTLSSGMETTFALCGLLCFALVLADPEASARRLHTAVVLAVLLYATRPDTLILTGTALGFVGLVGRPRPWLAIALLGGAIAGLLLGFHLYYGSALPTAFLLKNTDHTLYDSHFIELSRASKLEHLLFLGLTCAPACLLIWKSGCTRRLLHLLVPAALFIGYHAAFTVEVMGMHARFYAPALPLLAVAACEAAPAYWQRTKTSDIVVAAALYLGLVIVLVANEQVPGWRGWPIGRTAPTHYFAYALAWLLLLWTRTGRGLATRIWGLLAIALSLAIYQPSPGLHRPPRNADYVAQSQKHVRSFRGLDQLHRCLGDQIHVYHSEIGAVGMRLRHGKITDLGGIMTPALTLGKATFESLCQRDQPHAIFLPHQNYRALNAEIMTGACIRSYVRVVERSSSPLYLRGDLVESFRCR